MNNTSFDKQYATGIEFILDNATPFTVNFLDQFADIAKRLTSKTQDDYYMLRGFFKHYTLKDLGFIYAEIDTINWLIKRRTLDLEDSKVSWEDATIRQLTNAQTVVLMQFKTKLASKTITYDGKIVDTKPGALKA